jgi:hypothetical protein
MILVPLLNPKFATRPAAILGELRVRGTSAHSGIMRRNAAPTRRNRSHFRRGFEARRSG